MKPLMHRLSWLRGSPAVRAVLLTLVPVVVLGVVLATALNYVIKDRALEEAQSRAAAITRLAAAQAGVDPRSELSGRRQRVLRRVLRTFIRNRDAVAAPVWNRDGTILYSVGTRTTPSRARAHKVAQALKGSGSSVVGE